MLLSTYIKHKHKSFDTKILNLTLTKTSLTQLIYRNVINFETLVGENALLKFITIN